ncbi:AraC family transcriptional regulator [Sinomicrobium sp. M5D2P9]
MKYISIQPPASLSKYVSGYWVLEGNASKAEPFVERVMADGLAALVFHYDGVFDELFTDNRAEKSIISAFNGPSQQFRRYSIDRNFGIFGVDLYPYTIPYLFSIPATELKNSMLDLKTLLGKEENGLEEQIMSAKDLESRVSIVSRFLEDRLRKVKPVSPGIFETINYIIKTNGIVEIDTLSQQNFLSVRQFQRNFKQFSGFSPKTFSRIIRFQNALSQQGKSGKTLTHIALDAGYTDQSHFIRDFKEFSGLTPKEYFYKTRKNPV